MNIYLNCRGLFLKKDAFNNKKIFLSVQKMHKCAHEESRNTFSSLEVKICILF